MALEPRPGVHAQVEATLKRMDLGRMEGMKAKALALLKAPPQFRRS